MIYPTKTVYLAGPITGLTYEEARDGWRKEFDSLMPEHILCKSPMRGKEFLAKRGILASDPDPDTYPDNPMVTSSGIVTRDFFDVRTSDVMVACFLEANGIASLGTAVEFGLAYSVRTPIVMIADPDDMHAKHAKHVFLAEMAGYHVYTLEEGARIVEHLLTPSV